MTNGIITNLENEASEFLKDGYILSIERYDKVNQAFNEIVELFTQPVPSDFDGKNEAHKNYHKKLADYHKLIKEETLFNFHLSKNEYLFLKSFLLNNVPYNRDNVLIWKRIKEEFFDRYDDEKGATKTKLFVANDNEVFGLNISEITRISHLTAVYEGKGTDVNSEKYASIISLIIMISKVFELFREKGELLKQQGDVWLMGFDQAEQTEQINS